MKVSISNIKEYIIDVFKAGLVPMVTSSPGIGKSTIYKEIAKQFKLKLIDVRLSQALPEDLNGFPFLMKERNKSGYVPMDTFPIDTDEVPEGYEGWLLLLDEFNSAPKSVEAAAYKITLDRMVGQYNLHPAVAVGCAGNLITDKAIVNKMSSASMSRMIHFELTSDKDAWMKWAVNNNIDHRIRAYINFRPDNLNKFDSKNLDDTYPCQRTWEFTHKLIKPYPDEIPLEKLPLIAGAIGEGIGREFLAFTQIYGDIPDFKDIVANPTHCKFENEPSHSYALVGVLGHHTNEDNIDKVMLFIDRMGKEFQVMSLREILHKNRELKYKSKPVKDWLKINARELLGGWYD